LKKLRFLRFFGKTTPTKKFSESCSDRIRRDTDNVVCSNFVKFGQREIGKIMRCLPDEKKQFRLVLQLSLLRELPQSLPGPNQENVHRVLQILSKSVQFRRSYTGTREHRQNGPYK